MGTHAPGWYQFEGDPSGTLRWYDGESWTGQTRAPQSAATATLTSAAQRLSHSPMVRRIAPASATAPPELWLVSIALIGAGGLLLWPAIRYGYIGIDAIFSGSDFGRALGALILIYLTIIGAMGLAFILLAVGLLRASRVAQILTCVTSGITALSVAIVSGDGLISGGVTALIMLILLGVVAAITLRPAVRAFFARDTRPMGVAIAATANAYFGWVLVLDGALFLLASTVGAEYAFVGLLMLGASIVLIRSSRPLRTGDRAARTRTLVAYGLIALGLIVLLASGGSASGVIVPFSMLIGGTIGLTMPVSSKVHFGDMSQGTSAQIGI